METKKELGVAIAGIGFGEKVHLTALQANPNFHPIALWHPRLEALNDSCKKHNLKAYSDWSSLLNNHNIEAIIIATPPKPRFQLALEALEAGKHLLLEKPVALNSNQVEELQRTALKQNLSVAVDFEYRAVPLFMQLKRLLNEQKVGDIWLVKFDWLMSSRASQSRPWNWYSNKDEGGGVIGALGTHAFDILHWLFGPTNSVNAHLATSIPFRLCNKTNTKKGVSSEDICLAQIELEEIKQRKKIPAQVSLSSVSRQGRGCWLEIYGSEGTLIIGSDNQKDYVHGFGLWFAGKDGALKSISADKDLCFKKTWKDGRIAPVAQIQEWWLESIHQGKPIIPGLGEGLASQKVCDKLRESAESGLKIQFSSLI